MDGAQLRRAAVFHAIAASGGITAAARMLGKSPPAVHHDLKRFETEIGHPLFERAGRNLRLTADGLRLFETIGRALDDIERVRLRLGTAAGALHPLRVAVVSGFGRYRLAPALFAAVPKDRPVELRFGTHEAVLEDVQRQRVEFALTYRPVIAAPMQAECVVDEEFVLLSAKPLGPRLRLDALQQHPFVTYDEFEYVFARWFNACFGRQPERLQRVDHTAELEEALTSCAEGRGLTIAPRDAWERGPLRDRLTVISASKRTCWNAIYLCGYASAMKSDDANLVKRAAA